MTEASSVTRLRRRLWRVWLRVRHRPFSRRHRRLVMERIDGIPLLVLPDVFNPVLMRTGVFLARTVPSAPSSSALVTGTAARALDVGTGSGIGAIFAARRGYRVIGVDLNPEAVRCARINVLLNDLERRVEIRLSDLFKAVTDERFDLVLFNPPFYRGTPHDPLDQAWRATDVMERFAHGLGRVLTPDGEARVVLSTDGAWRVMLGALDGCGFTVRSIASHDFGNEVLTVYAARLGRNRAEI